MKPTMTITIGVLALQGAFIEHVRLLQSAIEKHASPDIEWSICEIRKPSELEQCDALIIPGGESTTMALVAERSGLMEPLRAFVKYINPPCTDGHSLYRRMIFDNFGLRIHRRPVWGTCAGLILLAEAVDEGKKGGQELIGGLGVRARRNYFGRQIQSFQEELSILGMGQETFRAIFIRAPVVEELLPPTDGRPEVEILARLSTRKGGQADGKTQEEGAIVAVKQGNVFATSFHPELTSDERLHWWWLTEVMRTLAMASHKVEDDRPIAYRPAS